MAKKYKKKSLSPFERHVAERVAEWSHDIPSGIRYYKVMLENNAYENNSATKELHEAVYAVLKKKGSV